MNPVEDLDRRLALVRVALSPTGDAEARVHARLAARGAFSPAVGGSRAGAIAALRPGVATLVSVALMGASFAAGYWLRDTQTSEPARSMPSSIAPTSSLQAPAPREARAPAMLSSGSVAARSDVDDVDDVEDVRTPVELKRAARRASPEPAAAAGRSAVESRPARRHPAPTASLAAAATAAAPATAAQASPHASLATATDSTGAASELSLLRRAERALRAGDPALALLLLDQLDRAYPTSTLDEERSAARMLVECARSGPLAKPEAARFLKQHPSSVYSDRILRACQLKAPDPAEWSADVGFGGH